METSAGSRVRFGVFEADLAPRELWKAGRKLRLQGQPFQLLALLLSRPGEVVTKGRADRAPLGELSTVGAGAQSEHRRRKDPYRSRRPGRQPTFRPDTAFRCLPLHRTGRVRTREASTAPVSCSSLGRRCCGCRGDCVVDSVGYLSTTRTAAHLHGPMRARLFLPGGLARPPIRRVRLRRRRRDTVGSRF